MNAPDITDGWTLHRDPLTGLYRAEGPNENGGPCAVHRDLGNGRTELSAWVELYDILCERYEDDKRELPSS